MRGHEQKVERQKLLVEIIGATPISRQSQLVSLLRKNGYSVTQTSVSRDLEDLGISKVLGTYRFSPKQTLGSFGFLSFQPSGESMIVARCGSGLASALAVQLDSKKIEGIAGTIAGDDTVFIALTDSSAQQAVMRRLRKEFDDNI